MTNFNGFNSPDGFTQIPNDYLDFTISPECDLSKVQMQVMNLFFRETFGWQEKSKAMVLSINDIMAILGLSKRNTVVNALNGLVEGKQFLESVEVRELPNEVRQSIEISIDRTLQPRQKLYRLNLVDRKYKGWDFTEKPHINITERRIQSSNQKVTTKTSNQKVTTLDNKTVTTLDAQMVTTLEAGNVGAVEVQPPLNKTKEILNKISSSDSRNSIDKELKEKYPAVPIDKFNEIKEALLNDATAITKTDKQYKGVLEYRLSEWKPGQPKQPKQRTGKATVQKDRKPIRTELLPDWFDSNKEVFLENIREKTTDELKSMGKELEGHESQLGWLLEYIEIRENGGEKKQEIENMLKKLRS